MSGLLRRIRPRRAADPDAPTADHTAALTPGDAREDAARALPAGVDPDRWAEARDTRRRGPARRRLRHVRRVRELLLRDLGGYVYELHRTGSAAGAEPGVMTAKLQRLTALDAERADLEERLGDRTGELLLREPGIGGRCATCGELHGSEARFCATCGMPLVPGAARPLPALEAPAEAPALPSAAPAPAAQPDQPTQETVAAAEWLPAGEERRR